MWITRSKSYKKLAKLSVLCSQQFGLKVKPEEANEDKQNLQINRIDQYQFQIKVDSSFEIDEKALLKLHQTLIDFTN